MKFFLVFAFLFPFHVFADFKEIPDFSVLEITNHRDAIHVIEKTASDCLQKDLDAHYSFYKKWGISKFYGDRSSFSKLSFAEKKNYVKNMGLPPELVQQLEPTSCVGLVLKCLGKGFTAASQQDTWAKLRKFTVANGVDGTALQFGLRKLGWRVLYWNPDTSRNQAWDLAEREKNPTNSDHFWGDHEYNWLKVVQKKRYYLSAVDDATLLVDFGRQQPAILKEIPFFVGTAHMGYHVFPGSFGQIIEGHSTRLINDSQTLETSPFNPMLDGGGPRGQYFSGLIAVPPGYTD